ncbi:MAG: hypothetical protein AAGE59_21730 [Cyanobacteria bacterium P01_F01_bin.86]
MPKAALDPNANWHEILKPLTRDIQATDRKKIALENIQYSIRILARIKMGRRPAGYHQKGWTTAVIWGCAVGMFALCIPLIAIAKSGLILPILVILGASGGTAAVWLPSNQQRKEDILKIQALEERVMTLETIYTTLPEIEKPHHQLLEDRQYVSPFDNSTVYPSSPKLTHPPQFDGYASNHRFKSST